MAPPPPATGISILAVLADRDVVAEALEIARVGISILAVLADRDQAREKMHQLQLEFQSSRSLRTATAGHQHRQRAELRISILAVLADRDYCKACAIKQGNISILAVLADRDSSSRLSCRPGRHFNPRGPCGPRLYRVSTASCPSLFQSSRSLRTATIPRQLFAVHRLYFNPRGPCGPRLVKSAIVFCDGYFNPRGPCGPRREHGYEFVTEEN